MIAESRSVCKVMVWVCPFIRPDSEEAPVPDEKEMGDDGEWRRCRHQLGYPAPNLLSYKWWNGFSMVMDFTNPEAIDWYQQQLDTDDQRLWSGWIQIRRRRS